MITADEVLAAECDALKRTTDCEAAHRALSQSPDDFYLRTVYSNAVVHKNRGWRRWHDLAHCHCGQPVTYGFDGNPTHHRGMCEHCDAARCDAYPGECGR